MSRFFELLKRIYFLSVDMPRLSCSTYKMLREQGLSRTLELVKLRLQMDLIGVFSSQKRIDGNFPRNLKKYGSKNPKVTVIVPNYNHEHYLKKRLDSIYSQTYTNFEVILLDDCSTDNSLDILKVYRDKYSERTALIENSKNSGGVFNQWKKGLQMASGDIIWIAESDDYCDITFLESLVPSFEDEAVLLSYGRTVFVNTEEKEMWSTEEYLRNLSTSRWMRPFVNAAALEVENYFSKKNIIPNASSALFRNFKNIELLNDNRWLSMRICGDWVFYLYICRGGAIAYSDKATNYYRIHTTNTSVTNYKKDIYYREHQYVGEYLAKVYKVSDEALKGLYDKVQYDWLHNRQEESLDNLLKIYNKHTVSESRGLFKANIAMCIFGFVSGGGETFPIRMANVLKRNGYSVTLINFDLAPRNEKVRQMLDSGIGIVNLSNIWDLKSIVHQFNFDIIHSHHASIDITISMLNFPKEVRHVVTTHGMYEGMKKEDLDRNLPKLAQSVYSWVYTADKNLNSFKKYDLFNNIPFTKIRNGVDIIPLPSQLKRPEYLPRDAFVLCLVSRAIREKGWREAIEVVSLAREKCSKNIHLLLIGDGPEYEELHDKVPSYVHCLGFREKVYEYFAISDMGFLPTYFSGESYPLVILDCFMAGRPCIASNHGDIKEMMTLPDRQVIGEVFDLKNGRIPIPKVVEIVVQYATNPELLESKCRLAQESVYKFGMDDVIKKYESVYF